MNESVELIIHHGDEPEVVGLSLPGPEGREVEAEDVVESDLGGEHEGSEVEGDAEIGSEDGSETESESDNNSEQDIPFEDAQDSEYYDSEDPLTVEEETQNDEGNEVQSKYNDKYPKYNPKCDPPIVELELSRVIKAELNINITMSMCRRAIMRILKKLDIGYESQFKRLRDYAQECLNSNPGSTVKIKTTTTVSTSPLVFKRIYVCFNAMKKGFLAGCRKFIGLDGCFLKGKLKGEILTVLLKTDLDIIDINEWTLMSDQQKGLSNVIQGLFPGIQHRNCASHVHANWSKSHQGKVLKTHFWQIAKTPNEAQLADNLKGLEKIDVAARVDLEKYPMQFWCKAYFKEDVKCDTVDNNLSEAFNKTLLNARSKFIIPMLEDIRVATMKRVAKKKAWAQNWRGNYGSLVMKKLNESILGSASWEVTFNGAERLWQLTGIPCRHGICAIFHKGHQPEEYIHKCYSKDLYLKTYEHRKMKIIDPCEGERERERKWKRAGKLCWNVSLHTGTMKADED
ncbi:PREDICTED: uncharacterized protein LOC109158062 [Ipomoea nil]|uniref:uncharacterized protein LOC109158062 n=1 Tax=Ipomoea nil TaxID=35883 RepID=UPI000901C014|nr:PREDICTED: uncharacterized protein LOC109158062 [Ipomoea nil]